jgi:alpha-ketoglutarate-dependent taurine dioxygenase
LTDTVWVNTVAAYDTLPSVLSGLADQLWALHSNAYDYGATRPNATARQVQRYERIFKSTVYETEHPVVQMHPLTGERAIILGSFVRRLLGVSLADSAHLLPMPTRPSRISSSCSPQPDAATSLSEATSLLRRRLRCWSPLV